MNHRTATNPHFDHSAILHDGPKELAVRAAPELAAALSRGEPVHVSLTGEQWDCLAAELGSAADRLHQLPQAHRYTNPGRAMAEVHRFVTDAVAAGAQQVWSIGSVPFENDERDSRWVRYEASVDDVLSHLPLRGICAYDTAVTSSAVEHAVRCCHSVVDDPGVGRQTSGSYRSQLGELERPLLRTETPLVDLAVSDVTSIRHALSGALDGALSRQRMDDLKLIVTEMATNALRHGGEPVTIKAWVTPTWVEIQVTDQGDGVDDRYADLRPLAGGCNGGFGMWLIGQMADQVWIGRSDHLTVVTAGLLRSNGT